MFLKNNFPFFLSGSELAEFIKDLKDELVITNHIESREIVRNLIESGKMKNAEYSVLVNNDKIILFKKLDVKGI